MFTNETKIDVETTLEVHGKCGIISTSEEKNTDKQKMKTGIISMLTQKKKNFGKHKKCTLKM